MAKLVSKLDKRIKPTYQIGIVFPDGKRIVKSNLNLDQLFDAYFANLDNNLAKRDYSLEDAQEIYDKYKELYKSCKIQINYIDSWEHKWKNSWPKEDKFINYIKEKIYDRKGKNLS